MPRKHTEEAQVTHLLPGLSDNAASSSGIPSTCNEPAWERHYGIWVLVPSMVIASNYPMMIQ